MDICDSLISPSSVLNEQVARQVFQILPEDGPMMMILDRNGNSWPSDTEAFARLNLSELALHDLCARIDDGQEPVMTQLGEHSIVATQLATEHTNCGYVIFALPQHSPEKALVNGDLIELVLNQIGLILKLIERNNRIFGQHFHGGGRHESRLVGSL